MMTTYRYKKFGGPSFRIIPAENGFRHNEEELTCGEGSLCVRHETANMARHYMEI